MRSSRKGGGERENSYNIQRTNVGGALGLMNDSACNNWSTTESDTHTSPAVELQPSTADEASTALLVSQGAGTAEVKVEVQNRVSYGGSGADVVVVVDVDLENDTVGHRVGRAAVAADRSCAAGPG